MKQHTENPWLVDEVDAGLVERLSRLHTPDPEAVALGVDIVSDPQREDDEGYNWTRLSHARTVADVVPSAAIVVGSSIGRYLARVVSWDFEVSDDDTRTARDRPRRRARPTATGPPRPRGARRPPT